MLKMLNKKEIIQEIKFRIVLMEKIEAHKQCIDDRVKVLKSKNLFIKEASPSFKL